MSLTKEQLKAYEDSGLIFLPGYFSEAEVAIMKAEVPKVFAGSGPQKVMENGGRDVRSVYGAQFNSETFKRLTRHARIAKPAIAASALSDELVLAGRAVVSVGGLVSRG